MRYFNNLLGNNILLSNQTKGYEIQSIAKIKPLSRSFFKMIEIIYEFIPNIFNKHTINSLHIAEGPGGFIEATRFIRNNNHIHTPNNSNANINANSYSNSNININSNSNIYMNEFAFGITLIDTYHKNVPSWKQSNIFLKKHPEVIISTGIDGTGNIYNIQNILYLGKQIKSKLQDKTQETINEIDMVDRVDRVDRVVDRVDRVDRVVDRVDIDDNINLLDFITADGGFDYSVDYNYQEQASSKLIFSQIIIALKYQKNGGDFVCKFFDFNSYLTIEMLYILYLSYDNITIYKPFTSRIANSEKYIICNSYHGINTIFLNKLFNILNEWHINNLLPSEAQLTVNQLFDDIPLIFIETLKDLNTILINNQIQSITNIINIVKTKMNLNKEWKKENIIKQIDYAKQWCKQYNIPY